MYIASGIIHVVLKVAHTLVLVLGLGPGLHYTLLTTAQQTITSDGTTYEKICTKIFILVCLSISIPYFAVE